MCCSQTNAFWSCEGWREEVGDIFLHSCSRMTLLSSWPLYQTQRETQMFTQTPWVLFPVQGTDFWRVKVKRNDKEPKF